MWRQIPCDWFKVESRKRKYKIKNVKLKNSLCLINWQFAEINGYENRGADWNEQGEFRTD